MKGSVLTQFRKSLWGAGGEKPRASPLFGALLLFLNHSICVPFSLTNGILFPFSPRTGTKGRGEGQLKKWSRKRVYKMVHFMSKTRRREKGGKACAGPLSLSHLGQIKSHRADGDSLQGKSSHLAFPLEPSAVCSPFSKNTSYM